MNGSAMPTRLALSQRRLGHVQLGQLGHVERRRRLGEALVHPRDTAGGRPGCRWPGTASRKPARSTCRRTPCSTSSKPRSSRSAIRAPRSAGCSQARELMPVSVIRRRAARVRSPSCWLPVSPSLSRIVPQPVTAVHAPLSGAHVVPVRVVRQRRRAVHHQVDVGRGAVGGEVRPLPVVPADRSSGRIAGPSRVTARASRSAAGAVTNTARVSSGRTTARAALTPSTTSTGATGTGTGSVAGTLPRPSRTAGRRPAPRRAAARAPRSSSRGQKVNWSSHPSSRSSVCTTGASAAEQRRQGVREPRGEHGLARAARPVDRDQPGPPQAAPGPRAPAGQLGVRLDAHRRPLITPVAARAACRVGRTSVGTGPAVAGSPSARDWCGTGTAARSPPGRAPNGMIGGARDVMSPGIDALLEQARAGLHRLTPQQTVEAVRGGALLVDTRTDLNAANRATCRARSSSTGPYWSGGWTRPAPGGSRKRPGTTGRSCWCADRATAPAWPPPACRPSACASATDMIGGVDAWLAARPAHDRPVPPTSASDGQPVAAATGWRPRASARR